MLRTSDTRLAAKVRDKTARRDDGNDRLGTFEGADGTRFQGAKGVSAWHRQRLVLFKHLELALRGVDRGVRALMGIREGQSFRLPHMVQKLFNSYSTKVGACVLFAEIEDGHIQGHIGMAKGYVAQALRWLAVSTYMAGESNAWRTTILPVQYPYPTECRQTRNRLNLELCELQGVCHWPLLPRL